MLAKIPVTIVTGFLGAGQDDADPPYPRQCRRTAARADHQRIRRRRRRRRHPEGLRRRGLPAGRHHRARQRLHLLHRGRRFRPGRRGAARARAASPTTSSSRPPASRCRSRWSRRSTGRSCAPGSPSTASSRWSTPPRSRTGASPTIRRKVAAQRAADPSLDHDNPLEEVYEDQLLCADIVVLNKTDLVDASGARSRSSPRSPARCRARSRSSRPARARSIPTCCSACAPRPRTISPPGPRITTSRTSTTTTTSTRFVVAIAAGRRPRRADRAASRPRPRRTTSCASRASSKSTGKPMRLLVQGVGQRFRRDFDRAVGAGRGPPRAGSS